MTAFTYIARRLVPMSIVLEKSQYDGYDVYDILYGVSDLKKLSLFIVIMAF
jgi:hypothetical protein